MFLAMFVSCFALPSSPAEPARCCDVWKGKQLPQLSATDRDQEQLHKPLDASKNDRCQRKQMTICILRIPLPVVDRFEV